MKWVLILMLWGTLSPLEEAWNKGMVYVNWSRAPVFDHYADCEREAQKIFASAQGKTRAHLNIICSLEERP